MVHSTEVSFDERLFDNIAEDIGRLPKQYEAEFNRRTRNPIRNLTRRLRREPARQPTHPFVWSYEESKQARARRWWFAAINGRIPGVRIQTQGGRYKRTGKGVKSIRVLFSRRKRTIEVETGAKGFGLYVVGVRQVPSHKRTGWKRVDIEIRKAEVQMLDNAIAVWDDITNKVGDR